MGMKDLFTSYLVNKFVVQFTQLGANLRSANTRRQFIRGEQCIWQHINEDILLVGSMSKDNGRFILFSSTVWLTNK